MKAISLTIDGRKIAARPGEKVLWAALDNGIYIPNLCAVKEAAEPASSCRLCFVEIAGYKNPVTACTEPVAEGMVVSTQGHRARRLARTSLELLLASHPLECARCQSNGSCELQRIAAHLGIKLNTRRFRRLERDLPVDDSSPVFTYYPSRCVLCGRCVWLCRESLGIGAIGFARRGFRRAVTTFASEPLAESRCLGCGKCVAVCPVGALVLKEGKRAARPD